VYGWIWSILLLLVDQCANLELERALKLGELRVAGLESSRYFKIDRLDGVRAQFRVGNR
jgi:hypothetical protein